MFAALRERDAGSNGGIIRSGDLVIVYEGIEQMKGVTVHAGKRFQSRFGVFLHDDWIGRTFGCKVYDREGSGGFVQLLAPSAELWTKVLPHRTQILHMPDIAMVVSFLNLAPGSVALESGTGSGSLTHSLARAVAPSGSVHTFDFHEVRASAARAEFERNGIDGVVHVAVRDIQGEGFPESLHGCADAAFLDLPSPWLAVPSASRCLRPDSMLCSFSPCIEQVQRCCEALRRHSFTDIRTFEVLLRTYDLRAARGPHRQAARGPAADAAAGATAVDASVGNKGTDAVQCPRSGVLCVQPSAGCRGHTGYLTFARLWV